MIIDKFVIVRLVAMLTGEARAESAAAFAGDGRGDARSIIMFLSLILSLRGWGVGGSER